jgi:hypothetical protein
MDRLLVGGGEGTDAGGNPAMAPGTVDYMPAIIGLQAGQLKFIRFSSAFFRCFCNFHWSGLVSAAGSKECANTERNGDDAGFGAQR